VGLPIITPRAGGNSLQHVGAAVETAVGDHGEAVPDGLRDFGQDIDRRDTAVELAAAVVGDHDSVTAEVGRPPRVQHV
jgi:hypothetical protein